jgi:acyl-CoA thioester hydrolase
MRPEPRAAYAVFRSVTTRWMDNDVYGHVNNAVYYSFFDTAVSGWLLEQGLVVPRVSSIVGYVVHSACDYFDAIGFPDAIETGLRVDRIGNSSVRYGVGVFRAGASVAAAQGVFTHAYVDAGSGRPVVLPVELRQGLAPLVRGG